MLEYSSNICLIPTMKSIVFILLLFLVAKDEPELVTDQFKELYRLEGRWQRLGKSSPEFEEWKLVQSNLLEGRMYKINGNDTIVSEETRLVEINNVILYQAKAFNQPDQGRINFKLTSNANDEFIFENAIHDFPKRIVYQFNGSDSLHAWVDGGQTDNSSRIDFFFRKLN